MPLDQDDAALLWDMLVAGREALSFVAGRTWKQYAADRVLQRAMERQIEIIGEAARGISRAFQDDHPEIPWSGIIGQRHVLAHDYGDIVQERIWEIVTVHVPPLIERLRIILPDAPPGDTS